MKTLLISIALVLSVFIVNGQNITGKWNGKLNLRGRTLTIAFNVKQTSKGLVATMDSPDQNVYDFPTSSTVFEQSKLSIKIEKAGIEYQGTLNENNQLVGVLIQSGEVFPLDLSNPRMKKIKKEPIALDITDFKFTIDSKSMNCDIVD